MFKVTGALNDAFYILLAEYMRKSEFPPGTLNPLRLYAAMRYCLKEQLERVHDLVLIGSGITVCAFRWWAFETLNCLAQQRLLKNQISLFALSAH
jgi:hypothetical protein